MTMLRDAVMHASTRPEALAAVARVYADLQHAIDARRPLCTASGRCCRFDEFGHRLYVTTIELAAFVASLPCSLPLPGTPGRGQGRGASGVPRHVALDVASDVSERPVPDSTRTQPLSPTLSPEYREEGVRGCPFQFDGLCSVHTIRPFGCRVFFCDATSDEWQHQQYERFHTELKRLHEVFDVPYQYVEWRDALRQLALDLNANGLPLAVSRTQDAPIRETASGNRSASGPRTLSLPQLPL
jgi:hypothetical protein